MFPSFSANNLLNKHENSDRPRFSRRKRINFSLFVWKSEAEKELANARYRGEKLDHCIEVAREINQGRADTELVSSVLDMTP
jgi:hypothetical protein